MSVVLRSEPNTTGANSDQFQTQTATFTIDDMHITRTGNFTVNRHDDKPTKILTQ